MKNVSKIDHVILKMLMMAQRPTWGLLLPGVCLFDSKAFCQSNGSYQLSTPVWSQLHTPMWWRKDLHIYIYIHIMLVTSWVLLLCGMLRMLGLASEGEVSGSLRTRGS